MIRGYAAENGRLVEVEAPLAAVQRVVWFDLFAPSRDEETAIEAALGLDVPTREEMEEIEVSSRLYAAGDARFMTALLPARSEEALEMASVTFILTGARLITVRYHQPSAFTAFLAYADRQANGLGDGQAVLVRLLDAVVDRLADILERAGRDIDRVSTTIFQGAANKPGRGPDYRQVLQGIGRGGDLTSKISDSLLTLERLLAFLAQVVEERGGSKESRGHVRTLARDAASLSAHAAFLSQKVGFLLDATLGLITTEQNGIIKILSVAAAVFLPPTLIASIYGMNFATMPELDWRFGYPLALGLMVLTAVLPFWFFKRRGWL